MFVNNFILGVCLFLDHFVMYKYQPQMQLITFPMSSPIWIPYFIYISLKSIFPYVVCLSVARALSSSLSAERTQSTSKLSNIGFIFFSTQKQQPSMKNDQSFASSTQNNPMEINVWRSKASNPTWFHNIIYSTVEKKRFMSSTGRVLLTYKTQLCVRQCDKVLILR